CASPSVREDSDRAPGPATHSCGTGAAICARRIRQRRSRLRARPPRGGGSGVAAGQRPHRRAAAAAGLAARCHAVIGRPGGADGAMTAHSESVLEQALVLAVAPTRAAKPAYVASTARKITRRGILWLGQTCNLRCHFCYFLDRIEDEHHPE